jgi:hypothetical protein
VVMDEGKVEGKVEVWLCCALIPIPLPHLIPHTTPHIIIMPKYYCDYCMFAIATPSLGAAP